MLRMDQVHVIRHKVLVEGQSRRQVAQQMQVSRNTVRKYIAESEPVFRGKVDRGRPVLDKVKERLDELLEEWSTRTTQKQRITGTRLHRQLVVEGYQVGVTLVRGYFREWRRQRSEVFIPLVHVVGDEAQVDFFEVTVEIGGERVKRWLFAVRLMWSGRDFAWLYERCDQVSFLDGHVRAFAHLGGVPLRMVYDNLSPAVRKVLFPHRELTARFRALVSHYLFEPCFARPGTGHDKGGIEGRGKGIRCQLMVPIPRGDSLQEMARELLQGLDEEATRKRDREGRTIMEKHEEERPELRPLPERPFDPRMVVLLSADRQALVRHAGETYSVPSHWKSLDVTAYVGPVDIRFVCRDELVVRDRVHSGEKAVSYRDYLPELRKKPQAVRQVSSELLSQLGEPFDELWQLLHDTHGGKEAGRVFAKVLGAVVEHGEQRVAQALRRALDGGRAHLLELGALYQQLSPTEIEVPESLRQYVIESVSASEFDALLCESSS
jgi:transposase